MQELKKPPLTLNEEALVELSLSFQTFCRTWLKEEAASKVFNQCSCLCLSSDAKPGEDKKGMIILKPKKKATVNLDSHPRPLHVLHFITSI